MKSESVNSKTKLNVHGTLNILIFILPCVICCCAGSLDWVHICRSASKVVTFIDLAGHEKYLKTTIFGMTGHAPDFCMLMVGSNAGIIGMTKGGLQACFGPVEI